jgi:hypothetical protein
MSQAKLSLADFLPKGHPKPKQSAKAALEALRKRKSA